MDVLSSPPIPLVVADLRPAADAIASARQESLPPGAAPALAVWPPSSRQGGLVAQSRLGAPDLSPAGRPDATGERQDPDRPERVLKPWGVPMLPAEERRVPGQPERARPRADDAQGPKGSAPAAAAMPTDGGGLAGPASLSDPSRGAPPGEGSTRPAADGSADQRRSGPVPATDAMASGPPPEPYPT